jgi:hypothetical protein
MKIKAVRKITDAKIKPAADGCGSGSENGLDKPPC